VEAFGNFCDAAAMRGLRVELEFVPFWGIPDLGAAWDVVRRAGRPNAGIPVDTWHLQKGSADFERDLQLLAELPPDIVTNIQLADAQLASEAENLYAQGRLRRFPFDGELAIDRIARIVARNGTLRRIGTEIFGAAIDELSNVEAGRRSASATRAVIERTRQTP
jgi:sugar phosphate isomerase/epimerase